MNRYVIDAWDLSMKDGFESPSEVVTLSVEAYSASDALSKARSAVYRQKYRLKEVIINQ